MSEDSQDSAREYLTADELRDRLYQSFRSRGFINSLKKQLRSSLVTELQHSAYGTPYVTQRDVPQHRSLLDHATNSLVADHLRRCQYDYSLSVFLPECGISPEKIMTTTDVLQLLRVSSQSKLYRKLSGGGDQSASVTGFLWQLISELCSAYSAPTIDNACQTHTSSILSLSPLDDKLITVDDLYATKSDEISRTGRAGVEDRILSYQKHLEQRSRTELNLEMARFRDVELSRMRLEENEKLREESAAYRAQLERTYQSKFDALKERERNSEERMQREQEMKSREVYCQRQSLLEEIEMVRQREIAAKRHMEAFEREKQLTEERYKAREELAKKREAEVEKLEREYEVRLQNEMTKFRLEEQAKYLERTQNLDIREVKLKENERRIQEDIDKVQNLKDDVGDKAARINELETILQESRHGQVTATRQNELLNNKLREMIDYGQLKEENAVMRHELDRVKTKLSEITMLYEKERRKNEELIRTREQPNEMTVSLQREVESAKDSLNHQKTILEQTKSSFDARLKEEMNRKVEVINQLEQQTIHQREMSHELEDLRHQLMHARNALNNEVFRKGKQPSRLHDDADSYEPVQFQTHKPAQSTQQFVDISSDEGEPMTNRVPALADDVRSLVDGDSEMLDADVVAEAKYRLKSLDKEAENLQAAYQQFHHRITNIHSLDNTNKSVRKLKPGRSKHNDANAAWELSVHTPKASPIKNDPPLSSTPYKMTATFCETGHIDAFPDLHDLSYEPPAATSLRPLSPGQSDLRITPVQLSVALDDAYRKQENSAEKIIHVDDLEERSGSPGVKVIAGSESDSLKDESVDADLVRLTSTAATSSTVALPTAVDTSVTQAHSHPTDTPTDNTVLSTGQLWNGALPSLDSLWQAKTQTSTVTDSAHPCDLPASSHTDIRQDAGEYGTVGHETDTLVDDGIDPVMKDYMAKIQNLHPQKFATPADYTVEDKTPSVSEVSAVSEDLKSEAADFDDW